MHGSLLVGCALVALAVAALGGAVVIVLLARRSASSRAALTESPPPARSTQPARPPRLSPDMPPPLVSAMPSGYATQGGPPQSAPPPVTRGRLVWTGGPLAGSVQALPEGGLWIGRETPAQVVVPDAEISRLHCWVGVQEGEVVAVDEGSSNGTVVMGEPIGWRPLRDGDVVVLARGAASFRYESAGGRA